MAVNSIPHSLVRWYLSYRVEGLPEIAGLLGKTGVLIFDCLPLQQTKKAELNELGLFGFQFTFKKTL